MPTIAELKTTPAEEKLSFSIPCVLRKQTKRVARNGSPFTVLELGDRTGSFQVVLFEDSPHHASLEPIAEGAVVRIKGESGHYQGRFSPKLMGIEEIPEAEQGELMEHLVEASAEDPESLWESFQEHIGEIENPALRETVQNAVEECGDRFRTAPAAVSMHHAYRHGLLEHTVHMLRAAKALFPLYPEVDADLCRAGIALHDIGKTIEYGEGLATRRTRAGILQGHVVLGFRITRRAALRAQLDEALLERLEHIILSHQGLLEWGAAAMAATPEAVFVSMVDNLDAKMGMVQYLLRTQAETGDEFSEYHAGLAAPLMLQPPHPPAANP